MPYGSRRDQVRATYLLSGGTGALGLRFAQWLVDAGARNIVLPNPRNPATMFWHD